jgi:hypothetical protein
MSIIAEKLGYVKGDWICNFETIKLAGQQVFSYLFSLHL